MHTLDKLRGGCHYSYEPNGQLRTRDPEVSANGEGFRYDPAANRLDLSSRKFDKVRDNRISAFRHYSYRYDPWGNLIEKRSRDRVLHLEYDCENRLVQTQNWDQGRMENESEYRYDSLGRRVSKMVNYRGGVRRHKRFLWQGLRMLREETPEESLLYLYEPGSYAPLARIDQKEGEEQKIYYFHTDQIGTPLEMTDSEGTIVWRGRFWAWGQVHQPVVMGVEQNLRFQGQYFDEESELHYNTFRYYEPEIGRFVTQDPIGLLGGLNSYEYADNPIFWTDPLGLCSDKGWGAYYASRTGTRPPSTMAMPHAHHIVFKGEFARSPAMQKALGRSRGVLGKYKIDPVHDTSAMMWAENQGHTIANARLVASKLELADKSIMAKDLSFADSVLAMKSELQKIGAEIFGSG